MKLLLAEDERSLSKALSAILAKNNYTVDAVYDGADALAYLECSTYDGVILDVMMPKTDGITVLKTMRQAGNKTPVLMLTAKSEIDDKVLGLDSGANDYLTKPFAIKELLARIRAMTRTAGDQSDARIFLGNITLDTAAFRLSGPAGQYTLASKEYQMLELLMRNPRNLLSTEHLMEQVWGCDSDVDLDVVWVYISYLRKKLTAIGADVQIKTKRGVGYYLEVGPC